jgi:hypothetical protein
VRADMLSNPTELNSVIAALRGGVQTDMGALQMILFARDWQAAQAHSPVSLVLSTAPGNYLRNDTSSSDLLPVGGTFDNIQKQVQNIFSEPVPAN